MSGDASGWDYMNGGGGGSDPGWGDAFARARAVPEAKRDKARSMELEEVQVKPKDYKLANLAAWLTNKIPDNMLSKVSGDFAKRKRLPYDEQLGYWITDLHEGFSDNVFDHYRNHPNFDALLDKAAKADKINNFLPIPLNAIGIIGSQLENKKLEREKAGSKKND
jgi:hypothetical protein